MTSFPWPTALLREVQAAAEEEHRSTEEILLDAVRLYLQHRRHMPAVSAGPAEKARAFEAWAHGHSPTPLLSDEAVRRGNLIRGHLGERRPDGDAASHGRKTLSKQNVTPRLAVTARQ